MKGRESEPQAAPAWYEELMVDGVRVRTSYRSGADSEVTEEEAMAYVVRCRKNHPNGRIDQINLLVDGDEVEITCRLEPIGFDRIRRMRQGA